MNRPWSQALFALFLIAVGGLVALTAVGWPPDDAGLDFEVGDAAPDQVRILDLTTEDVTVEQAIRYLEARLDGQGTETL